VDEKSTGVQDSRSTAVVVPMATRMAMETDVTCGPEQQ
jgi:hypothetical protein